MLAARTVERLSWRTAEARDLITLGRLSGARARLRWRIEEASRRAWVDYRAGAYRGKVAIVRSAEFRGHSHLDRWHALETGGIEEVHVIGTHRSMLREPDVASLAEIVRGLIDQAIGNEDDKPPVGSPARAITAR